MQWGIYNLKRGFLQYSSIKCQALSKLPFWQPLTHTTVKTVSSLKDSCHL